MHKILTLPCPTDAPQISPSTYYRHHGASPASFPDVKFRNAARGRRRRGRSSPCRCGGGSLVSVPGGDEERPLSCFCFTACRPVAVTRERLHSEDGDLCLEGDVCEAARRTVVTATSPHSGWGDLRPTGRVNLTPRPRLSRANLSVYENIRDGWEVACGPRARWMRYLLNRH